MIDTTILLRQIHPSFQQNGRVTSQAFRPTPKDESKLSVYDGDLISAADAWTHYVQSQQLQSDGVMGVTVRECTDHNLPVAADPEPHPAHALVDFADHTANEAVKISKKLKASAEARSWLHQKPPA